MFCPLFLSNITEMKKWRNEAKLRLFFFSKKPYLALPSVPYQIPLISLHASLSPLLCIYIWTFISYTGTSKLKTNQLLCLRKNDFSFLLSFPFLFFSHAKCWCQSKLRRSSLQVIALLPRSAVRSPPNRPTTLLEG